MRDLQASKQRQSLRNLQAEAFKPTVRPGEDRGSDDDDDDEEEEEVEERVVIRSLDEKVAVGGKNFSQLIQDSLDV